ncbi:GCN5 family acetyltransferase [Paenibacillus yonginensis]|uniref:GCN5 family acetyltransferase n=1 Tax=Paenibacillus yonginensis TaxID=1462996 RepID=A0A1B1MWQ2_9BACL|nr:GNAT family N-acetyltransferase [Paenibacillus yonginensis]ANS73613.1 GCN5 family acetyltransferase [Paenibacillus yonginensis]
MIRYRRPKQDDPVIYGLIEKELVPHSHLSSKEIDKIRRDLPGRMKHGVTLVAASNYDSDPLAFIHFMIHGELLYIDMIAVDRNHQHKRYGKSLMAKAENFAASRGCSRSKVLVDAGNTHAHLFYSKLGYRTVRFVAQTQCYEMEKSLVNLRLLP